jgi:hypothetical protein
MESIAEIANAYLDEHLAEVIAKYRALNTSGGTLAVSSDAARELLPGYATPAERTANTFALGPASSRLADAVWQEAMREGPTEERYAVEFLTGSPGSGKTRSVIGQQEETPFAVITEGMMDDFDRSAARIQQALDQGFVATLRLVYVDDPRTTIRRAVARAMEFGRPVPIAQMSHLYVTIPKTIALLYAYFGDELGVSVFENSRDGSFPLRTSLETALRITGAYTFDTAREAMLYELDRLRDDGKVSQQVYAKFLGAARSADASTGG